MKKKTPAPRETFINSAFKGNPSYSIDLNAFSMFCRVFIGLRALHAAHSVAFASSKQFHFSAHRYRWLPFIYYSFTCSPTANQLNFIQLGNPLCLHSSNIYIRCIFQIDSFQCVSSFICSFVPCTIRSNSVRSGKISATIFIADLKS